MKWLEKLLDLIFKHMYSVCAGVLFFTLGVLLITMSAQYIGDKIGQNILNHKSIELLFLIDKNDKENLQNITELIKTIENNYDIRKHHIKIKKINIEDDLPKPKDTKLIITTNKQSMEQLSNKGYLAILDRSAFNSRTHKYLEFSRYDEFVLAETTINNLKIYLAYTNIGNNTEKVKAIKTISTISGNIVRKEDMQPEA